MGKVENKFKIIFPKEKKLKTRKRKGKRGNKRKVKDMKMGGGWKRDSRG